jgi:hypothetical protein
MLEWGWVVSSRYESWLVGRHEITGIMYDQYVRVVVDEMHI